MRPLMILKHGADDENTYFYRVSNLLYEKKNGKNVCEKNDKNLENFLFKFRTRKLEALSIIHLKFGN